MGTMLAALAACATVPAGDTPGADVVLSTSAREYAAGDTVTLTLENRSSGTVSYNLCSSALERRGGEGWEAVSEDRVCTRELRILEAGGRASYPLALASNLPAGEYRYRTGVEVSDSGGTTVATEPFRVTAR